MGIRSSHELVGMFLLLSVDEQPAVSRRLARQANVMIIFCIFIGWGMVDRWNNDNLCLA
jgi:hypothetical protein